MSDTRKTGLEAQVDAAWSEFRQRLADRLEQVEEDDVLLIEMEGGAAEDDLAGCTPYAQFCSWGEGMIRAEVVSDHYLDARYELGVAGDAALRAIGWDPPGDDTEALAELNYSIDLHQEDVEQLAAMVVRSLREVYGCPHPAFVVSDDFEPLSQRPAVDVAAAVAASRAAELDAVQPQSASELQALVDAALEVMFEGPAEHDSDGDVAITCGQSQVFVRVAQDLPAVDVFAQLVLDVKDHASTLELVNEVNAASVDRQLSLVDDMVLARTRVLATPFAPGQLRTVVHFFCDGLDDLAERVARAGGGRRFHDRRRVPPRPRPVPVADGLTALLEVLHEEGGMGPSTTAALLDGDRQAIVGFIVAIRNGIRDLDGLDEDLVLGHLRRALRHLAARQVTQDRRLGARRDGSRRDGHQLALLPDEGPSTAARRTPARPDGPRRKESTMGSLNEVLRRIEAGDTTAEEAAPEVRRICRAARTRASTRDETFARMAGSLDDRDATDTFLEVTAAWSADRLTDEQYQVLRAAVLAPDDTKERG